MERTDLLLLIGTFIFGFGAGVYVYFALYEPNFRFGFSSVAESENIVTVVGDAYGACAEQPAGCGSFRVQSNRDYRMVKTDVSGMITERRTGLIPSRLMDDLLASLRRVDQLDSLDRYPIRRPLCQEAVAGVVYTVEIPERGRYYIDICSESVTADDTVWVALERLSQYFELRAE